MIISIFYVSLVVFTILALLIVIIIKPGYRSLKIKLRISHFIQRIKIRFQLGIKQELYYLLFTHVKMLSESEPDFNFERIIGKFNTKNFVFTQQSFNRLEDCMETFRIAYKNYPNIFLFFLSRDDINYKDIDYLEYIVESNITQYFSNQDQNVVDKIIALTKKLIHNKEKKILIERFISILNLYGVLSFSYKNEQDFWPNLNKLLGTNYKRVYDLVFNNPFYNETDGFTPQNVYRQCIKIHKLLIQSKLFEVADSLENELKGRPFENIYSKVDFKSKSPIGNSY